MEKRNQSGEGLRKFTGPNQTEKEVKISEALDKIGKELGGKRPTAGAHVCRCIPLMAVRRANSRSRLCHGQGAARLPHRGALSPRSSSLVVALTSTQGGRKCAAAGSLLF